MIRPTLWTVVTRKPRGRYLHPVAGFTPTDWHGAVAAASVIVQAEPNLEVWYTTTEDSPTVEEDRNNVMLDDGRRLPIRWDSEPQYRWGDAS